MAKRFSHSHEVVFQMYRDRDVSQKCDWNSDRIYASPDATNGGGGTSSLQVKVVQYIWTEEREYFLQIIVEKNVTNILNGKQT